MPQHHSPYISGDTIKVTPDLREQIQDFSKDLNHLVDRYNRMLHEPGVHPARMHQIRESRSMFAHMRNQFDCLREHLARNTS